MAKTKISEYDSTAANNADIDGINIAESCPPSGINNAIRELMAHLKDWQSGASGDKLPIASGGTNAGTAEDARTNLSAAKSGANSDITSLTGLTTALTVAQGGTGATTLTGYLKGNGTGAFTAQTTPIPVADGGTGAATHTANAVLIGEGTDAISSVSPSTSGNVLTSDGTNWVSAAPTTGLTRETEQATTSGTSVEWTSLPSTITRITVVFNDMGAGTDAPIVQLGDSSGYKTSGYVGVGANIDPDPSRLSITTGLATCQSNNGEHIIGNMIISNVSGDTWISSFNGLEGTTDTILGNSRVTLSGTLDRLKVTTISGTTFDNGSVNIIYE